MIRQFLTIRLRGGALYLVVSFSIVIAITLSMVILLRYYNSVLQVQTKVTLKLIRNLESGLEFAKASDIKWIPEIVTIDLFGRSSDTLVIRSWPWGVYNAVAFEARAGKDSERQCVLLGNQASESHRYAIRLANRANSKLKVMENTRITGDVMVPSGMVIPTFYNGKPFQGDKAVDGLIFEAHESLPAIDANWLVYANGLLHNSFLAEPGSDNNDSLRANSFFMPTQMIAREESIDLHGMLKNNIVVYSSVRITVTADALLDGVLLAAPIITIADSVKGRFQAVASNEVTVGNGVRLNYPSALVLVENGIRGSIIIGDATIQGSVVMINDDNLETPELKIENGAHVVGEVFVQGDVQLYGKVTGSILCDRFMFHRGGEVRENALCNATIEGTLLPKSFVFSKIYDKDSPTGVACRL